MKEKTRTVAQKKSRKIKQQNVVRRALQVICFIVIPSLFSEAFAGVKGIFLAVGQGNVIEYNDFLRTFMVLAVATILFGRYFCGYACAFGAVGDFIYGIKIWSQKKGKIRFPRLPEKLYPWGQKIRFVNLIFILSVCIMGKSTWISGNSPWEVFSRMRALDFHITSYGIGGSICLGMIVIGMFLEERFFCQFLCPLGAIFSMLPILPWCTMKRNSKECIPGCGACKKQCPVHHQADGVSLHSNECIQCGKCRLICPKGNIYKIR